ncbi:TPA: hypothetical protein ACTZ3A_000862 [Bacillus cereus]|uniref:hypothetical protein n=1 Tax=Bacillus cereus group sp. BfR-BA-01363 TaxID=3094882 RepID=UPI0029C382FD|nr:hypothetical protein [Bacillus cereus group sp. BfR-BA-01363]MDX5853148.1 hypothetical protein [Bacillus cereus group sp. BfR-BA-01363]
MNIIEAKKLEKKHLEKELMELENQEQILDKKKRNIASKIEDCQREIEREIYHGMTQYEYFNCIHGAEFKEGKFHIRIGGAWGNGLYVNTNVGDMKLSVQSKYDDDKRCSLNVSKDYSINGRGYEREHEGSNIPEKYKEVYQEMLIIKSKYGKLMGDAKIDPIHKSMLDKFLNTNRISYPDIDVDKVTEKKYLCKDLK